MSLVPNSIIPISPTDDYYDLGTYSRKISTKNEAAQTWFDRGLVWCYAFNHAEAYRCFEQAIAHDSQCAMAYWGLVYAAGPNYNKGWGLFDPADLKRTMKICHDAARHALGLAEMESVTHVERALIEAMQARYPVDHPVADYTQINHAYDQAMRKVHEEFPDDLDMLTLYIDAKMHIAQRKMFHTKTGLPIETSPVFDVQRLFTNGLNHPNANTHPGLLHFCIHFWEMSATPSIALPPANALRNNLVPDAGHLHHMPTHLDVLLGDYSRGITSNAAAIRADEKYLARNGAQNMYSFYRLHNYHSLIYNAMLAGQSRVALQALDRMEASITVDVLRTESPPLADWLEFFLSVRVHVYIRFGLWDQIIPLPTPEEQGMDKQLYCVTTAMTLYGKGIAHAATGNLPEAHRYRDLYTAAASTIPPSRRDHPNRITDILKVATAMLNGEIEYRAGNFDAAFDHLRDAIAHDDNLLYTEPWGWMVPTRHAFGALSLERGNVEDAARVYREDLGIAGDLSRAHQHPRCVWALRGYWECLVRLGRGGTEEAGAIKRQLDAALAVADVEIRSSCFCRLGVVPGEGEGEGEKGKEKAGGKCCDGPWLECY
ncbi:tetratricopeptide repeat domain protein [Aspergillus carlsbadensis]|nr:tetratricopeptide repeat domain protein [Aspergillus carlsbadensis]